jgi:NAD(P)-dependent dehydrogenase (short-subunit alcohol dehydrogenase family)
MSVPGLAELLDFTGRSVIVTGASQGIGAAIALRFAEAGGRLVIHYRSNAEAAEKLAATIRKDGGDAVAVAAELSDPAAVRKLMTRAVTEYGCIDVLINNAGAFPNAALLEMSHEEWTEMQRANVDSCFLCTQAAARHMQSSGGGAIVNIASIAASSPGPQHSHYNSAKAAVVMLTRSAAQELGVLGIRVNAVSPGVIGRDGIEKAWPDGVARWKARAPLQRLGQPEDVADACLFLASGAARWITGHDLVVDGGVLAASIY